jgi:hypothetical protein
MRSGVAKWAKTVSNRKAIAYIGTDHALTDPDAVRKMVSDGVEVRLMMKYSGVFHPKVFWLFGPTEQKIWVGSNNLTRDGLLHNIEFATYVRSQLSNAALEEWHKNVEGGSVAYSDALISSYESERHEYAKRRADTGTFTWSKKTEPPPAPAPPPPTARAPARSTSSQTKTASAKATTIAAQPGDLVIEIMPRETGMGGKQVQLPKDAAVRFFGLGDRVGATKDLALVEVGTSASRQLRLRSPNKTGLFEDLQLTRIRQQMIAAARMFQA